MREIKFRAWDKDKQTIVYDVHSAFDFHWGIPYLAFGDVLEDKNCKVMQYTGLKDKNGKEIYEGDVYRTEDGEVGKIVFDEASFKTVWLHHDRVVNSVLDNLFLRMCKPVIIGNVFENPGLLK